MRLTLTKTPIEYPAFFLPADPSFGDMIDFFNWVTEQGGFPLHTGGFRASDLFTFVISNKQDNSWDLVVRRGRYYFVTPDGDIHISPTEDLPNGYKELTPRPPP